jgi:hypothetical protein
MSVRRVALALSLTAACGCHAHVLLPLAPPPSAPFAERVRFFRRYRPSATAGAARAPFIDRVVLNDGTTVYDPGDLLQMVDERSSLNGLVRGARRARALASGFSWSGVALVVVGGALSLGAPRGIPETTDAAIWAGVGILLGGLIATFIGMAFERPAIAARETAFEGLDRALRERMALCVDGDLVRDCAATPPAEGAPR